MDKISKKELVESLKNNISDNNFVLSGFNGLTVSEMEILRNKLRLLHCSSNVVKNRLLFIALKELGINGLEQYLADKTILAIQNDKSLAGLKEIAEFAKKNEKFFIKAGFMDGRVFIGDDMTKIANLPSKEVLISKLLAQMNAPISKFVYVLNNPISKLVYALEAIKNKKN
jgi:large subunit ribosomal protein L10